MTIEEAERYLSGLDLFRWRELAKKAQRERRARDAGTLKRLQGILDAERKVTGCNPSA
jgi:hypothetical protein